ncbi:lipopolysaccharide assembly protein B [Calothrix sp. NIES-4071]|nr:lipopolysaccharide assembly protein B [Calothrix sp. NIES-4071]BAZ63748.1 lipopolysaccharide assembly protein B [Calothrix sp. NIES-4105]
MKFKSILFTLTILCLGVGAIPIETTITYANSNQSQNTQLKLKGIPLACYISVGEPSAGEGPLILAAEFTSQYWANVSLAYADAGQFDQAIQLVKRMDHDLIPKQTKVEIATLLAKDKQYNRAIQLVQSINDEGGSTEKARGLAIIGRQYAKAGNKQQADRLFSQALKYARSLSPELQNYPLADIAIEYATANRFTEALQLANRIKDKDSKGTALSGIAVEYALASNFNKGIELAQTITGEYERSKALESIASQTTISQLPQLQKLAFAIKDDAYKAPALVGIAKRYINLGQIQQALNLEKTIVATDPGGSAYYKLPGAYASKQRFDDAIKLVNKMQGNEWQSNARASVILEYARNNQYDKAQSIINALTSQSGKNKAIQALAQGYAEAGQYQSASKVLKTVQPGNEIEAPANRQHDISLAECAAKSVATRK